MKTILVLEEDFSIMKPLAHTLPKQFSLIEATTAEQSLRRFIEHDRRVDLLPLRANIGETLLVA